MYDILIAKGLVVDPRHEVHDHYDLAVAGGEIVEVAPHIPRQKARRVVDATGKWVLPGLIDLHVHLSEPFGGPHGHYMLAKAGVTCALDLAGQPEALITGLKAYGTGLTLGFVYPLIPGESVTQVNPSHVELNRVADWAVKHGALGIKVLGGHYPLTPDATAQIITLAHSKHIWCAIHAGTTVTGSNIEGLEELVNLADGQPLHIAHVNSYCRGQKTGDPLVEASRALKVLARMPQARSESYLALINGADATIENGTPKSNVVKTCLQMGGYSATATGMEEAILAGWAHIHEARERETRLLNPEEGLSHFRNCKSHVGVSFPVNPPGSAIALAVAKTDGKFTVTALSTDGGAIPRNTTLEQGLALVRFGALSLDDFVMKACLNPARMLGWKSKGHLGVGASGDVTIVDPATSHAEYVIAHGQVIVQEGNVVGRGGRIMATEAGRKFLEEQGVEHYTIRPDWLYP